MTLSVTLFSRLASGEEIPIENLLPLVYQELHRMATGYMRSERAEHTLQPTALVHEAFVKLVGGPDQGHWKSRSYFFAAAAASMRRILIDHARRKRTLRRGGNMVQVDLSDFAARNEDWEHNSRLLLLDEALTKLQDEDPQLAKLVELRIYGGLGYESIAEIMAITVYQAKQKWQFARAWLKVAMEKSDDQGALASI
ncbi:ECF sigma factor [Pirellula sp. SH-Sr6A]|uniref:ECF-type sigma factor n=1 Tax=Pirellula sp. SH-Sr6A TaxID=1632865 RepID=UPI00078D81E8|nr:ECF-type sigma factor [Pirellula sp. SH-Sr6A]AMV35561.1 ECF sigma factor [Pirellula sp. SH-Sr6A]